MNEYKLRYSTVINYWVNFRIRVIIIQYFKFDCLGTL